MFYRTFLVLFLAISFQSWSQEYEIKSEYVEINTRDNQVIYKGDVQFLSEQINFSSNKLVVDQKQEQFSAEGNPINISYIADGQQITGTSMKLELFQNVLSLSGNVQLITGNNKIASDSIVIKLNND
ncbi:MAG: LPS export ABC transporter periplasmic protein LptC [SAR86 cluster bacterium]|uniref:LPS export ABC transporter periplasmic protein LptC n=1 Tax=SAR86 cluster bacterium TaxID=2030880 RepID=A0A937IGC5_9GAMM|nr:LPS export ABC transporter periplasmic protein LptC [SAR86 cluster bacterium]